MKCVAKTVTGAIAEIEVEPTDTLAELKVRFSSCASASAATRLDLPIRQRERRGMWMAFFTKSVQISFTYFSCLGGLKR